MAGPAPRWSDILEAPPSGSSRFKTGKANFCRLQSLLCSPSFFAKKGPLNQNQYMLHMRRLESELEGVVWHSCAICSSAISGDKMMKAGFMSRRLRDL